MKELDIVKLTVDYNGLSVGTKGTIVLKYNDDYFEVEFFDSNGDTIDVITISKDFLELVTDI